MNRHVIFGLPPLLAAILFAGCASIPPGHADEVRVFFATTRRIENLGVPGKDDLDKSFGDTESTMARTGGIGLRTPPRLGLAMVSVPRHDATSIGSENGVHITRYVPALSQDAKYAGMGAGAFYQGVHLLENPQRPAVVYVHGFNDDFESAAHRAAVFARDLPPETSNAAVIYSWPSAASLLGPVANYPGDEERALVDEDGVRQFLDELHGKAAERSTAPVLLIGHSLGCRILTYGLRDLWQFRAGAKLLGQPMFSNLVLIEPDVNEAYFCQNIARLTALCGRVTIYYDPQDLALSISDYLHNHQERLGQRAVQYLTKWKNVDMIDASALPSNFVHHSYDDPTFFQDLKLLAQGRPAKDRVGVTLGAPNKDGAYTFRAQ